MMPTILIVEDDAALLKALAFIFKTSGYNVLTAETGEKALKIALAQKPQLILLDIILPGIRGTEVFNRLRKDPWGKDVPVIMLTNLEPDDDVISSCIGQEPKYYLIKSQSSLQEIKEKAEEVLKIGKYEYLKTDQY